MNTGKKNKSRVEGSGRKSSTESIENEILFWINLCRRHGLAITCNQIIATNIKIIGEDFKESYIGYQCWVWRFLRRHNLVIGKHHI